MCTCNMSAENATDDVTSVSAPSSLNAIFLSSTLVPSSVRFVRIETPKALRREGFGEGLEHFFQFKIVHSGVFSYASSKVLYAIKCKERYVITVFLATDGDADRKTSSFHQSRKLIPIQ